MTPKSNIIYLWRQQDTQNNSRENRSIFENVLSGNNNISEIDFLEIHRKYGDRTILKVRSIILENLGDGIHIYQKTWNGYLDWNFGTLTLWNFETWQRWDLETFVFLFEGIPSTAQHTDSHPCTCSPFFFSIYISSMNANSLSSAHMNRIFTSNASTRYVHIGATIQRHDTTIQILSTLNQNWHRACQQMERRGPMHSRLFVSTHFLESEYGITVAADVLNQSKMNKAACLIWSVSEYLKLCQLNLSDVAACISGPKQSNEKITKNNKSFPRIMSVSGEG